MRPALESRLRPGSSKSLHNLQRGVRQPTSQVLLSALAVAAGGSWMDGQAHGSPDLLVLAYWGWRLGSGGLERMRGTSRKGKEVAGEPVDARQALMAVAVAVRSVAFFMTLRVVGPTRSIALLVAGTALKKVPTNDLSYLRLIRVLWHLAPGLLMMSSTIPILISIPTDLAANVVSPVLFLALSLLLKTMSLDQTHSSNRKPHSNSSFASTIISSFTATIAVFLCWSTGLIPSSLSSLQASPQIILASLVIFFLSQFAPISEPTAISNATPSLSRGDHLVLLLATAAIQSFTLPPAPARLDILVILPLALSGILTMIFQQQRQPVEGSQHAYTMVVPTTNYWSLMSLLPPSWRPHLQTILRTPTSSRIFYFLLLNLAYMGVQMAYGVLTNSLGLISDAIHMLFDCLGLGVGLWASVAATWKPDGRYTYGYSRVETLSGFANGCFLILISIFIIFEAIQRIIDPPEMETHQLLLVSSIGLAINLWGMYATGGHHHHGHGHGHSHGHDDHGHSHSHTHLPVNEKKVDHRHDSHNHSHGNTSTSQRQTPKAHALSRKNTSNGHDLHSHESSTMPVKINGHSHDHSNELEHHDHHDHHHHHDSHDHHHHDPASHDSCGDYPHSHGHSDHHHNEHNDHGHAHSHDHKHDSHSHSHGDHSHGHSHDHAHSHNMRGVFLHVLADTLGSVGVIISTLLIRMTGWTGFDPLASLFIAGLIMASVIPLVIDSGKVLCLDVGPETEAQIRAALSELSSVNGLSNYASPRIWPRCEGELSGSIHIQLAPSPSAVDPFHPSSSGHRGETIYANADRVVARVESILKSRIRGLTELVVQVEGSEDKSFCGCMTGR